MKCPSCSEDGFDFVVDSRSSAEGHSVYRRRECNACGSRFSTFEVERTTLRAILLAAGYDFGPDGLELVDLRPVEMEPNPNVGGMPAGALVSTALRLVTADVYRGSTLRGLLSPTRASKAYRRGDRTSLGLGYSQPEGARGPLPVEDPQNGTAGT